MLNHLPTAATVTVTAYAEGATPTAPGSSAGIALEDVLLDDPSYALRPTALVLTYRATPDAQWYLGGARVLGHRISARASLLGLPVQNVEQLPRATAEIAPTQAPDWAHGLAEASCPAQGYVPALRVGTRVRMPHGATGRVMSTGRGAVGGRIYFNVQDDHETQWREGRKVTVPYGTGDLEVA